MIGFIALTWFIIRVIPKPSRAMYPCQRIAFPLATGFVIWIVGIVQSIFFVYKAQAGFKKSRYLVGTLFVVACVCCLWISVSITSEKPVYAEEIIPNQPIGEGKGIFPGRVVWIHDPNSTAWNGTGDGYSWQPENTSQLHVDLMVSEAIRRLTGGETNRQSWDRLFRHFNSVHGKGDVGYSRGEKIAIKVNLTTCNHRLGSVDPTTYTKKSLLDKSDTSPQVIVAVLRQLVATCGLDPKDIAVGDTLCYFPKQWWDICHAEFPDVCYFDCQGGLGRTKTISSDVVQYWSHEGNPEKYETDHVPVVYADADYLINLAVLKGHGAGITLCAKNHYGSYVRTPDAYGYYDLHDSLAGTEPQMGSYRALVDIMGHPHVGGKTLLYMLDGLYGGYYWQGTPYRFQMAPFNNDWPSSIMVSQDPVAIDSVGLDLLWEEWPHVVRIGGVDDYLHEAALANNPPSGTYYDPDTDGVNLDSLGVHEHWNNPIDKRYSRNLGAEEGIELLYYKSRRLLQDLNSDGSIDVKDLIELADRWLWVGVPGEIWEDMNRDGTVNFEDFAELAGLWHR